MSTTIFGEGGSDTERGAYYLLHQYPVFGRELAGFEDIT